MSGSICVVGAGAAGACLVERIRANAAEAPGGRPIDIHLVGAFPAVGREDPKPWPAEVTVHVHRASAVDLTGRWVLLDDGTRVGADAVVLAQPRLDVLATAAERESLDFARRHALYHRPAGDAGELPLDGVPGGRPVLMRGLGPTFADALARLTTGRGGRFRTQRNGEPVYIPCGREPLVYAGSRRGVPYRARSEHPLKGEPPPPPRFVTSMTGAHGGFRREVWPLIAKDLTFAYYHELLTAHPERGRMRWADFADAYAPEEWDGKGMRALIRRAVPRFEDRLNLARLDRPLAGIRFGDLAGLQRWMHGYLAADLARRADPAHTADLALIHALRGVLDALAGRMPGDRWFEGFAGHTGGGLPAERVAELRALARAGVVTFVGPDMHVEAREEGWWRATSAAVPGAVTAGAFIEARRPEPSVADTLDPLVRRLYARGECSESSGLLRVRPGDRRVLGPTGAPHPRCFAFAPWTTVALTADDQAPRLRPSAQPSPAAHAPADPSAMPGRRVSAGPDSPGGRYDPAGPCEPAALPECSGLPDGADTPLLTHADSLARTLLAGTRTPAIARVA